MKLVLTAGAMFLVYFFTATALNRALETGKPLLTVVKELWGQVRRLRLW